MTQVGIRCMLMRGGTSKGAFFLARDLPTDPGERDELLLRVMGSPDPRQIDGVGGGDPLTTKVAIVGTSDHDGADVEYLFLQLGVDRRTVTDRQNCGNILAAVAPFAVERGLVTPPDGEAAVRILMKNTGGVAIARFPIAGGGPVYEGTTAIDGVPGTAAGISIDFVDVAGSTAGSLLPTGRARDMVGGVAATLVDNGMPVVVIRASDLGVSGYEDCHELETHKDLRRALEKVRLAAGPLMNLGDVSDATIPKLTLVSPPRHGGVVSTRTFIPHRCHSSIGVLGAVSVATACLLEGSPAAEVAEPEAASTLVRLEHPTGFFDAHVELSGDGYPHVARAGIVRTARKLMDGTVYPRSYT